MASTQISRKKNARHLYPPGPRGLRLAKMLLAYRRNVLGFWVRLAEEYGDRIHFRLGPTHVFFFEHPEVYRDVFVTYQDHFGPGLAQVWTRRFLGKGLVGSEGGFHESQRRLVQPAFHRKKLAIYAATVTALARETSDRWDEQSTIHVWSELHRLNASIMAKTLFNFDQHGLSELVSAMEPIIQLFHHFYLFSLPLGKLLYYIPWPMKVRFENAVERLDALIQHAISVRKRDGMGRGDVLSMLLGTNMTDAQVRDEIVTLFFAAYESQPKALTWLWYLLSAHPEPEKQLCEELARVLGGRLPMAEDIPQLPYTQAIVAETLRLYPPVFTMGRRVSKELSIGDTLLPAGSSVILCPYITQRDPRFFSDPSRFDPERWIPSGRETQLEFAYLPFGMGMRRCIGEQFARTVITLLVATIAQQWKLHSLSSHTLEAKGPLTMNPADIAMRLERRVPM